MARLTEQQNYLLRRLPRWYYVRSHAQVADPPEIKRARATVARYDERERLREKTREKQFNDQLTKAREAVYFLPPEKALKFIQDFEKKFPTPKASD